MGTLRDVLNRLRWDPGSESRGIVLRVLTRWGGEAGLDSVPFERIADITASGVVLGDGTFLPFHRIHQVVRGEASLWRRSDGAAGGGSPPLRTEYHGCRDDDR